MNDDPTVGFEAPSSSTTTEMLATERPLEREPHAARQRGAWRRLPPQPPTEAPLVPQLVAPTPAAPPRSGRRWLAAGGVLAAVAIVGFVVTRGGGEKTGRAVTKRSRPAVATTIAPRTSRSTGSRSTARTPATRPETATPEGTAPATTAPAAPQQSPTGQGDPGPIPPTLPEKSVAEITRDLRRSVVQVEAGDRVGSGVVYDHDMIVTAADLVRDRTRATVRLDDGTQLLASIETDDRDPAHSGIAFLRIEPRDVTPARLGPPISGTEQIGIVAVGSRLGSAPTSSSGTVTGIGRAQIGGTLLAGLPTTDLRLHRSAHGGAVADRQGRVGGLVVLDDQSNVLVVPLDFGDAVGQAEGRARAQGATPTPTPTPTPAPTPSSPRATIPPITIPPITIPPISIPGLPEELFPGGLLPDDLVPQVPIDESASASRLVVGYYPPGYREISSSQVSSSSGGDVRVEKHVVALGPNGQQISIQAFKGKGADERFKIASGTSGVRHITVGGRGAVIRTIGDRITLSFTTPSGDYVQIEAPKSLGETELKAIAESVR